MKNCWASLLSFALLAMCLWPSSAAAQIATGEISGYVKNQAGDPVAGATVTGSQVETGAERAATTSANGRFVLLSLARGTWVVRVEAPDFQTTVRDGLFLNVGQEVVVEFTLQVAASETLTITAESPIISRTQGVLGDTIQTETIDSLPTQGRDYREFTKLVPGVRKEETGSPRIGGQAYYSNTWKIDGLENDSESVGNPQSRITQDAIAEVQVSTNQYSAEFGRALGGAVNVITRSGTNDFRGRGFYYAQDADWNARSAFASSDPPKNQTDQFGATFGGPISRDKTHFFASVESIDNSRNTTLLDPTGGPSQTLNRPTEQLTGFFKLSHQIGSSHTFNAQYLYDDLLADGEGVGGIVQPSAGFERSIENGLFIMSDVGVLTPSIVNELRFQYQQREQLSSPNTAVGPEIRRPSSVTGRNSGLPFGWDENKLQIADTLSKLAGDHELKIGINYQRLLSSDWLSESFFQGQYVFDTDRPFNASDPSTYPIRYTFATGDATTSLNNTVIGVFVQDSWTVRDNVTLNLGLRYDRENGDVVDVFKGFPDDDNFGPRLSFAWNPGSSGKTTVRGGLGRFYYRIYGNLGVNLIVQGAPPPDGLGTTVQTVLENPGFPDPLGFNPNGTSVVPQGLKQGHFSDGTEETAYTDQISLGFGRELGSYHAISVDVVSSRGKHLSRAFDTNFPDPVTGERPRPDFSKLTRYDTNGNNYYDAAMVKLTKRMSSNYSYTASYTLSETEDDTWPQFITQFGAGPQAWYNPGAERALSASSGLNADDHERHRLVLSGVYQLPFGFNIAGIFTYHSARRYNITTGRDNNMDGTFADRPDFVNGQYVDPGTGFGVQGNVGKNAGVGSSYDSLDLRISKNFDFGNDRSLTIIAEAFNALNVTNVGGYFGAISSASFGEPSFYRRKRELQLGLQFQF